MYLNQFCFAKFIVNTPNYSPLRNCRTVVRQILYFRRANKAMCLNKFCFAKFIVNTPNYSPLRNCRTAVRQFLYFKRTPFHSPLPQKAYAFRGPRLIFFKHGISFDVGAIINRPIQYQKRPMVKAECYTTRRLNYNYFVLTVLVFDQDE